MIFLNKYSVELYSMELYSMKLLSVELRLLRLCSNSNLHSHNTLFWLKNLLTKCYRNEGLGLVWDRIVVVLDAPIYQYCMTRKEKDGVWKPNNFFHLKVWCFKGKKGSPFLINLIDICLRLPCLLFMTKNIYN